LLTQGRHNKTLQQTIDKAMERGCAATQFFIKCCWEWR